MTYSKRVNAAGEGVSEDMMRVAMYYNNNDLRLEEMPRPEIGPGEILLKIESSGICGTDIIEWYRRDKTPLVLGHEIAGEIVDLGEGITRYHKGERISASHHVPCNVCHYCLSGHHTVCETLRRTHFHPGGFAEYVRLPAINVKHGVYVLPKEVSFEQGTFIEPLACVLRGQRLAGMGKGKTVLVLGSGISGLLHIQMARVNGALRVVATDISNYRLKAAENFGADRAIHAREDVPRRLREANDGRLADLVVVCTGAIQAQLQALECVDRGGTVLFFAATDEGITIPLSVNDLFWRNEITLTSSYAASPEDHREALELIRTHKIRTREMITHRLGLARASLGFRIVAKADDSIKVIIEPQK